MKNTIASNAEKLATGFNKQWHLKHPMPKNATLNQRIEWHITHHEKCNCCEIPASIKKELENRKIKT